MWPFKRSARAESGTESQAATTGGTAVLDWRPDPLEDASAEELRAEVERLSAANRASRDVETERRLVMVRHLLGVRLRDQAAADPQFADPAKASLPSGDGLPEIAAAELTPELLRAGILRDGCLLVRGLIPRETALQLAEGIDRSFEEREQVLEGEPATGGYYEEFTGGGRFDSELGQRLWIRAGGGVLAGDSPRLVFDYFELVEDADLREVVSGYLGEPALISFEKTTLRKATPDVPGAWHQDGWFLGEVRALNLWLSLSRCGDEAPGLDIVPRRLEEYVTTATDEAVLSYTVSQREAEAAAGDKAIVRPVFEPGDALFFDEKMLHQTGSDPAMPNPRYAVESWFFGASGFPEYVPLAV